MIEVVSTRIDCQFVKQVRIEAGLRQEIIVGIFEQLKRCGDHLALRSGGDTHTANENWNRPYEFVLVRRQLLRFECCNWPMADVIVKLLDRPADNSLGLIPWRTLPQHCFAHTANEKGPKQRLVGAVK